MIPLKIQLKNFLSYGPELQEISFDPYPLICLSGKNGHGKSALLDAITWALWGQARKTYGTAKADEGLIRLGQTQMMVILDFSFNGQTYRIRREFAKTYGKPYAVLEFGLLNVDTDTIIPLTDKTIRQTQDKIERMLNLDAESFANSAFLRQGQANEFSKKSAKDRKTLLATILGLNRYDAIRQLAMNKAKDSATHKQHLQIVQEKHQIEIQKKPLLEQALAQVTSNLTAVADQEKILIARTSHLAIQRTRYVQQQQELQLFEFQRQQLTTQTAQLVSSLLAEYTQWRSTHKKLLSLPNSQQLELRRKELLNAINAHQELLQKGLELKEQLLATKEATALLEKKISQAATATINGKKLHIERLALEKKTSEQNLHELKVLITQSDSTAQSYQKELAALQAALAKASHQQANLVEIEKQFERRKEYYQQFVSQGTWIKKELDELHKKQTMAHDDDNPSCPLCEQNLSVTRKKFLKKRFDESEQFLQHRLHRLKKVTTHLKTLLIEQHAYLGTQKKIAQETVTLQLHVNQVEKSVQENAAIDKNNKLKLEQITTIIQQQELMFANEQKNLATLIAQEQQELQNNTAYQELITKIKALEEGIKSCVYNAADHKHVQQELTILEKIMSESAQIISQSALQEQRMNNVANNAQQLKKIKNDLCTIETEIKKYKELPEQLARLAAQEAEITAHSAQLRSQQETLLQEKGKVEHEQTTLRALEQEHAQHALELQKLENIIDDYQVIATATSKDGIQALLIEEAIPEIEQEANTLLSKLTNNQAQLFIESLRDLKNGGTKETLDIKISDTIGIRPYEMFSGGEAFRIDFALRIAISKLLARRAGASLQTLIIDEGFGSQDEEGLSHIMDALYKIQDDFAKVIIVSHLPFMKDQFPVHFVVEKGPNGSTVRTMEQG